ncbi:hypothetical protein ACI65C_011415 [Semiaphis heraclei]
MVEEAVEETAGVVEPEIGDQSAEVEIILLGPHGFLHNGTWSRNTLLLDLTVPGCLGCMRAPQYVPEMAQYIILNCGHGWYCSSCVDPRPELCEVCDDTVDDVIRIYLS